MQRCAVVIWYEIIKQRQATLTRIRASNLCKELGPSHSSLELLSSSALSSRQRSLSSCPQRPTGNCNRVKVILQPITSSKPPSKPFFTLKYFTHTRALDSHWPQQSTFKHKAPLVQRACDPPCGLAVSRLPNLLLRIFSNGEEVKVSFPELLFTTTAAGNPVEYKYSSCPDISICSGRSV